MCYTVNKHIKALFVLKRSIAKCHKKDTTAKTVFCGQERAKEQRADMPPGKYLYAFNS